MANDESVEQMKGTTGHGPAERKRVAKMRPKDGDSWLFCDLHDVTAQLAEADEGREFEIVALNMTDDEVNALPEFDGW